LGLSGRESGVMSSTNTSETNDLLSHLHVSKRQANSLVLPSLEVARAPKGELEQRDVPVCADFWVAVELPSEISESMGLRVATSAQSESG
jgi:hypothetical protein